MQKYNIKIQSIVINILQVTVDQLINSLVSKDNCDDPENWYLYLVISDVPIQLDRKEKLVSYYRSPSVIRNIHKN